MKKIIFVIIGIIIIVGIALAVTYSKQSSTQKEVVEISESTPITSREVETLAPATTGKKMSFGNFVKQGGSYQCAVSQYIDPSYTTTTNGTIYLSSGLVRGDFTTNSGGESMKISFIKRDGFVYTWIAGTTPGYKTPALETAPSSGQSGWTPDMVKDYDCKTWMADASLFTIPNIQFETLK